LINIVGTPRWVFARDLEVCKPFIKVPKKGKRKVRAKLDHNKVKELLEQSYEARKEKVVFEIVDLDSRKKIKPHLASSIGSVFTSLVPGVFAIIMSQNTKNEIVRNNISEAKRLSRNTRRLAYSGIFFPIGLTLWTYFILQLTRSITEIY